MRHLLTIGAFARAVRLSPKALRLYDELGLLRPAAVDSDSGYRFYDPEQLEQARLIAWLRRLDMPLARIRRVCELPAPEQAVEIAAYWERVLAETADRGRLAAFLVDHLSGRGSAMGETTTLGIRYAARSEAGPVRETNEDIAYAGPRLIAVADGIRGPGGDRASAAAVDALKPLETVTVAAGDLLGALAEAVRDAERAVGEIAGETSGEPGGWAAGDGPATTLTALFWSGSRLALAHIGDTRAYRLRDGELSLITHDHTYVRSLIEQGKLTEDEAATHPQRSLLVKALTGTGDASPDLSLHEAAAGDRYLLCSDGLAAAVGADELVTVLAGPGDPRQALDELIARAYAAGADDNVAGVVADVVRLDQAA
ncbi:MerR family transcriptional regulator [Actinoplanes sp. NEAU-A12]|uniref:MerR family transcriptional regulator n=1 Tax=Actinoplanes sandaracinus TaxID=3045177 RepID=A0ABT6WQ28_9ACTN|nr:MerR family transcriptional regulator [Actinoplanes sandaracinus]MDI6101853.1 MerR family transcriptional regulator [Actinoplanes sandaracinus]